MARINHSALFDWLQHREARLPRKLKKRILDRRRRKREIRKLLDEIVLGKPIKTMFEIRDANVELFCPNCGETKYAGTGNMTDYPEHWEKFYCYRCRKIVGYIDNSAFIHALECKEYNYDPVF